MSNRDYRPTIRRSILTTHIQPVLSLTICFASLLLVVSLLLTLVWQPRRASANEVSAILSAARQFLAVSDQESSILIFSQEQSAHAQQRSRILCQLVYEEEAEPVAAPTEPADILTAATSKPHEKSV